MNRMYKPALFGVLVTALLHCLSPANPCLADFSKPILGNNNVYMLSADSGDWERSGPGQLNFREPNLQTYRYAEWPGVASGIESLSTSEFLSLWEEGGAFRGVELIGSLSIAGGNGQVAHNVLVMDVRRNTATSNLEIVVDFGNAELPDDSGEATLIIKDWHGPATETVRLNLSSDSFPDNQQVVIFQENLAGPAGGNIVVWKTIASCKECTYPFNLNRGLTLSVMDSHGSSTSQVAAEYGQLFSYFMDYSGAYLLSDGPASDPNLLQVENQATTENIEARVNRDGRRLAVAKTSASEQILSFSFDQVLYIGVASNLEEGDIVAPDKISSLNKVPLAGIKNADIKTGGDSYNGYAFYLQNIEWR